MSSKRWVDLGALVRRERNRRGLTQTQVAAQFHVSRRTVGSVETGEYHGRDPKTLDFIEHILGWEIYGYTRFIETGQFAREDEAQLQRIADAWPTIAPDERRRIADWAERESRRG